MRVTNARVEVSISIQRGSRVDSPSNIQIEIEDHPSGEKLCVVDLTPEDFVRLVSGHGLLKKDAFVSNNLNRIGLKQAHRVVPVPRDIIGRTYDKDLARVKAREYAAPLVEPGEEMDTPRLDNQGVWSVVVRRWEAP